MAILEILEFPDPRLRTVARPVEAFDEKLAELVSNMIETMYTADGIGLAATQVNRHLRLLVMDVSETRDAAREYINPVLIAQSGEERCEEGCLSVPGIYADVDRSAEVTVKAQDRHGVEFEQKLDGMHAICLQHEMDHLEGKLFVDYLSPLKRKMVSRKLEKQRKKTTQAL